MAAAIQRLFSAYRRDDFADPEGFVVQLGTVLCDFPEDVVDFITSPRTGIQRRSKWPPTISEIVSACEEHHDHLRRMQTHRPMGTRLSPPSDVSGGRDRNGRPTGPHGSLVTIFIPADHARYQALVEWANDNDPRFWGYGNSSDGRKGMWVPLHVWEGGNIRSLNQGAMK